MDYARRIRRWMALYRCVVVDANGDKGIPNGLPVDEWGSA